jgi:lysozyme
MRIWIAAGLVFNVLNLFNQVEARPSASPNLRICSQAPALVPGADLSSLQPQENWSMMKEGGIQFVFIKASEGTTRINRDFSSQWQGANQVGIARGAYHYFHPKDDPRLQAQLFLNAVGDLRDDDLPAVLDWEVTDGIAIKTQIANALTWLQIIERETGKRPILYTGTKFWNSLGNPQPFAIYPLFIANYGVSCPHVPPPWSNWTFWQSGTGPESGVSTKKVDLDRFNGDLEQLFQL